MDKTSKNKIYIHSTDFDGNQAKGHSTAIGKAGGGGMHAHFINEACENKISIHLTVFDGNQAKVGGGGIHTHFKDDASNNKICIHSTVFDGNQAKSGGGAEMGYLRTCHCHCNSIKILDSEFISNRAVHGGGLVLFSRYFKRKCSKAIVNIANSSWRNNTANLGAAVDLTPEDPLKNQKGFLPNPTFKNCTFIENVLTKMTPNPTFKNYTLENVAHAVKPIYSGVFLITRFQVNFETAVNFTRNKYTALYVLAGSVIFKKNASATFDSNIGYSLLSIVSLRLSLTVVLT